MRIRISHLKKMTTAYKWSALCLCEDQNSQHKDIKHENRVKLRRRCDLWVLKRLVITPQSGPFSWMDEFQRRKQPFCACMINDNEKSQVINEIQCCCNKGLDRHVFLFPVENELAKRNEPGNVRSWIITSHKWRLQINHCVVCVN